MTEFEMAYLMTDMQSAIANMSTVCFTGVSGFLVGGYFAAHRLNRTLVAILIFLYTLWFYQTVFLLSRMGISLVGLVREIHQFAAAGKGLQWHSAAFAQAPDWVLDLGAVPAYVTGLIVYCGTIYFFLQCRRTNQKAEGGAWHPKI